MTRAQLCSLIRSDLHRYLGRDDWRTGLYAFLRIPGFRFTFFLRKASYHDHHRGVFHRTAFWMDKLILDHYRFKYGFQISHLTRLGHGLHIVHHGWLIVSPFAVLGDNVNLCPGAVIGQTNRGKRAGTPVIGNRVWIGANATIVGGVSVGDDAMIGPGAYVTADIPPGAVVTGNPGQIKSFAGSGCYVFNLSTGTDR